MGTPRWVPPAGDGVRRGPKLWGSGGPGAPEATGLEAGRGWDVADWAGEGLQVCSWPSEGPRAQPAVWPALDVCAPAGAGRGCLVSHGSVRNGCSCGGGVAALSQTAVGVLCSSCAPLGWLGDPWDGALWWKWGPASAIPYGKLRISWVAAGGRVAKRLFPKRRTCHLPAEGHVWCTDSCWSVRG